MRTAIDTPAWRSLLFVGADQSDKIARVATRGADAVILDLEDAVPAAAKPAARAALPGAILHLAGEGQPLVVRINSAWRVVVADLDAAARPGVSALMVPGCVKAERLAVIAEMLGELEAARGLESPIGLIALVESAAGLMSLPALAAAPRVIGLALGTEDLSLDMGVAPTTELLALPSRHIALAAHAHGLMALAVPISIAAFSDEDAYRAACSKGRAWGNSGAMCVHPRQVAIANTIFRPSAAELADARSVMAAWDSGSAGGVVSLDGRMIDAPVVERARRLLDKARN